MSHNEDGLMREACRQAAEFFLGVVAQVPEDRWDSPSLGIWTVRDLVGHTCRALTTVETYLDQPGQVVEIRRPVDYFIRTMESLGDPDAVAERGRQAGRSLGQRPAMAVREVAQRVLTGLERATGSAILGTPIGGMRLMDYLPTRIFELTIHTLDLASAIGAPREPPQAPMEVTLHLLAALALESGKGPVLALASTGRRPLPEGFNLVG